MQQLLPFTPGNPYSHSRPQLAIPHKQQTPLVRRGCTATVDKPDRSVGYECSGPLRQSSHRIL
jgi:hypothetical protein